MSRSCSPRALVALLALCAASMSVGKAEAGKRVVVLEFQGPNQTAVRAAIVRSVRGDHVVISKTQLENQAAKLGLDMECDPNTLPGLASIAKAEAVICGYLRNVRGRLELTLKVVNGGDGKVIRTIRTSLGRSGLSTRALKRVTGQIEPALARTWSWENPKASEPDAAVAEERRPAREAAPERTAPAAVPERNAWESEDRENPLAGRPRARSEAPASVVVEKPSAPRRPELGHALRLGVGPSFLFRRNYAVYSAASAKDARGWATSPVAGLALEAEFFPGAYFTSGWASGIGVGLAYSRYFGLSWRTSGESTDHSATHQVLTADLRGRYRIPLGPRAIVLGAHAGYRYQAFKMNDTREQQAVIPDVSFSGLDLGLDAAGTILPRWLAATARFSYLPVFGRGEIVTKEEYGAGTGGGLLFGGGLSGNVTGPFGWRLDVGYARYSVNFKWDPAAARHAEKARDSYLTGMVAVTFAN